MTKTIALIDYGSGNLRSASKAFEHVIAAEDLDYRVNLVTTAADLALADKIVLPGQGAFGDCMQTLQSVDGLIATLEEKVLHRKAPFFGICVGMQLLADQGHEHGIHKGLGWIPGEVVPLQKTSPDLKIPHMGWNDILPDQPDHFLLRTIKSASNLERNFYFVHSFMFQCKERENQLAHAEYGQNVTAAVVRDNIFGTQFHPEKSQVAGLNLIRDFLRWVP
ncbi:MAG: imidazole glycerol phosphate synthase subunit HisH [Rhodospirillales bacterium]|nr:imidazole glycerol phosphate synthase subunit HisH [Rhodospirillales bacterium]MCB9965710.1 imidazole glycerol phosphate synthase subunit HisH [Rhodospirillales bacterium]MCB9980087.1 imidazole glycerol phosphate synthase subunit HisH [Rhodospirillales bacterium]